MRNFVTQLWLFWHGQHGKVYRATFDRNYGCSVCHSQRWYKKNDPFRPKRKNNQKQIVLGLILIGGTVGTVVGLIIAFTFP